MFGTIRDTGIPIPVYGIMTALGILFSVILLTRTHRTRNISETIEYGYIGVWAGVGAFFTAHLFFAIAQYRKIIYVVTHLQEIFSDRKSFVIAMGEIFGGMVFYGGLIGACVGGYIYLKRNHLDIEEYADTIVPCIPLFHAFGRVGCFLTGCCYGKESDIGFVYRQSIVEQANGVRRFPVQLLESAENIVICIILLVLLYRCKNIPHGILLWIYGILYSPLRFGNEFLRGDIQERGYFGIFSTSQWISIVVFGISLLMLFRTVKRRNT